MFSFLFTYTLKSREDRDAFLAELLDCRIPEICSAEDGCNMYRYFFPVDDDKKICIVESWTDEQAQKKHTLQPHCAVIRGLKEKYGVVSDTFTL